MQSADRDSKPGVGARNVGPSAGHHFNYDLQVWVLRGRVKPCAHPTEMRVGCCRLSRMAHADTAVDHPYRERACCNAYAYQGMTESAAVADYQKSHPTQN